MKKQVSYEIVKLERDCYLGLLILMFFVLLGASCNFIAVTYNSGKMPVYEPGYHYVTYFHMSYQTFDEVNYYFLTDIFYIGNRIYSLGDFLMISGTFLSTILIVYLVIKSCSLRRKHDK